MFDTAAQRAIGPYAVHELVGWAWRACTERHTSREGADVAIKVLRDSFIGDAEYDWRFIQEINMAGRLSHPHILSDGIHAVNRRTQI